MTVTQPDVDRRVGDRRLGDRRAGTARFRLDRSAPRRLGVGFAVLLSVLGTAHAFATMLPAGVDFPGRSLLQVLDLGAERTVGTWVNSGLHALCALLAAAAALLARHGRSRWAKNWWLLAAAFAAMSLDEVATIHDRIREPLQRALDTSGVFHYAWVIPALVLAVVFLAVQARFLHALDRFTGLGLLAAGAAFVAGAAGMEMAEGWLHSNGYRESALYDVLIMTEELVEIGALMAAACILLRYLIRQFGDPQITFVRPLPSQP